MPGNGKELKLPGFKKIVSRSDRHKILNSTEQVKQNPRNLLASQNLDLLKNIYGK